MVPLQEDNLCGSPLHEEGNNHGVEGDIPLSPSAVVEVDILHLHDGRGGPCNQQVDNLVGRLEHVAVADSRSHCRMCHIPGVSRQRFHQTPWLPSRVRVGGSHHASALILVPYAHHLHPIKISQVHNQEYTREMQIDHNTAFYLFLFFRY